MMFGRTKDNGVEKHCETETVGLGQLALFSMKYGRQENEGGKMRNSTLKMFNVRCLWMICLGRKQQTDASRILFIVDVMAHTTGVL